MPKRDGIIGKPRFCLLNGRRLLNDLVTVGVDICKTVQRVPQDPLAIRLYGRLLA